MLHKRSERRWGFGYPVPLLKHQTLKLLQDLFVGFLLGDAGSEVGGIGVDLLIPSIHITFTLRISLYHGVDDLCLEVCLRIEVELNNQDQKK